MARTSPEPNADIITFRIPPALKTAFAKIAREEAKPVGELLRDLIRERIKRKERLEFEAEARRQSLIIAKEAADYLSGARMWLLEALVFLTAIAAAYAAILSIRASIGESPFLFLRLLTMAQDPLPSFIALLGFLIPLVAIAIGFDAINGEFNRRTLSRVLAQPTRRCRPAYRGVGTGK